MADISRDESFDLTNLLKQGDVEEPKVEKEEPATKEKTPVEMLMEQRNSQSGMVVSNEDLQKGAGKQIRSHVDNDDRLNDYKETLDSFDESIDVRKYLIQKRAATNQTEHMELMDELSRFTMGSIRELQKAHPYGSKLNTKYFDLAPSVNETPKEVQPVVEETKKEEKHEPESSLEIDDETENDVTAVEPEVKETEEEKERGEIVRVLIDKTNLGIPPIFDEVEKDKILNATQVDLVEVETVDLPFTKLNRPKKSFVEAMASYNTVGVQVPIVFPCSRFRASMTGLTYGEMGDIALALHNNTYDTEWKKLSVIYNKMRNVSCGNFNSFDEFLDGFVYIDIDMAVYGLYIASAPEIDNMMLTCGVETCKKTFSTSFSPRSLVRLERCSDVFLKNMKLITESSGEKAKELYENAPHKKHRVYKLPHSGWMVHVGFATCREYLDGIMLNDVFEDFKKSHPDDVNGIKYLNKEFIRMVRAISIPVGDGTYDEYTEFEDIIEALYYMNPDDYQILNTILDRYIQDYSVTFGIMNVECPHCGSLSQFVNIDINRLVFQTYQRRLTTTINLKKLEDL